MAISCSKNNVKYLILDADLSVFYAIALQRAYDAEDPAEMQDSQKRKNFILRTKKRLARVVREEYTAKIPDFDPETAGDSLQTIEKILQCKIYCWKQESQYSKWECIRHSPYLEDFDTIVDIIIKNHTNGVSLVDVGSILEVDKVIPEDKRLQRKRWTIFEAACLMKNPDLRNKIKILRKETANLEKIWGCEYVHVTDAAEFWKKFKLSLQVWSVSYNNDNPRRHKVFDSPKTPKLIGMFQNLLFVFFSLDFMIPYFEYIKSV